MYLEIDEGFATHRKTLRFCALMMDHNAFAYILRLWTWACRSAPDGDLSGMEAMDIEIAVQYRQADGKCYAAFVKAGFIDASGPTEPPDRLHNWMSRTGGAIKKMADEASRKKAWRDAHGTVKCPGKANCQICAGLSADSPMTVRVSAEDFSTQTSQDQTSQDQTSFKGEPAPAIPLVAIAERSESPPVRAWASGEWLKLFGEAWCETYRQMAYGAGGGDAKACGSLSDLLGSLDLPSRVAAQARAPTMFAEFLADRSPESVKRRHPFAFFVTAFNGLRVEKKPIDLGGPRCYWHAKGNRGSSRQPLDSCPECREDRARRGGRSGEPSAAGDVVAAFVPHKPPENPATAEEIAEMREQRKRPSLANAPPPMEPKSATGGIP